MMLNSSTREPSLPSHQQRSLLVMWASQTVGFQVDDPLSHVLSDANTSAPQVDSVMPPVRSPRGGDPSWLVPASMPQQQAQDHHPHDHQQQQQQLGSLWAAVPDSFSHHSVPDLQLPQGAIWGVHEPDLHRQRILMAAHERVASLMQQRRESGQVPTP